MPTHPFLRLAPIALGLSLTPGIAAAEGFSSGYITGFNSSAECMDVARNSMNEHFQQNGMNPDTGEASFSVFGFDVPPGRTQVAIICTEDNGRFNAVVTGYSLQEDGTRLQTVETFLDRLEGLPVGQPAAPGNPTPAPQPGGSK